MNKNEREFVEIIRANQHDERAMLKIAEILCAFVKAYCLDKGQKNRAIKDK